jgi:hypothetical protein
MSIKILLNVNFYLKSHFTVRCLIQFNHGSITQTKIDSIDEENFKNK